VSHQCLAKINIFNTAIPFNGHLRKRMEKLVESLRKQNNPQHQTKHRSEKTEETRRWVADHHFYKIGELRKGTKNTVKEKKKKDK
jgi:hypothetical protein